MTPYIEYQINTTGQTGGLEIPTGFRMKVLTCNLLQTAGSPDPSEALKMVVHVCTYADDTQTEACGNDQVNDYQEFTFAADDVTTALQTLIGDNLKPVLDAVYGAGNVVQV